MSQLSLTKEERHAVFAGTLKVLRRPSKPDQDAGAQVVISKTRGGRDIVDYETGETVEIQQEPRLWITVKGWHLRAGNVEWETDVVIHDQRENHRVLANGIGGIPRESGLKTRWGTRVVHRNGEVLVLPKTVPTKEQQKEHWTSETERGYGGRNQFERSADGDLIQATAVSDDLLRTFAAETEMGNDKSQREGRQAHRRGRLHRRLSEVRTRGMDRAASAIEAELKDC